MTEDRIHNNAIKAMRQWQAALEVYRGAGMVLVEVEARLRQVRTQMKDIETDTFLAGSAVGITGKNDNERKAQLAMALRQSVAYCELAQTEAALEKQVAQHRQQIDAQGEAMKMAAAVLRYASEERRESAERIALEGRSGT